MKTFKNIFLFGTLALLMVSLYSCQQPGGDNPGSEYMPDMSHSIAYEANYYDYYYNNTWGGENEYYKFAKPRLPVKGTIARSIGQNDSSGMMPYHYGDSDDERNRAIAEIEDNPYPITDEGLSRAKELYIIQCGICHGNKGDGNGWLVDEKNANAKYLAQPANFLLDDFVNSSNGRYYHSIMYGKNLMGSYADKLSYEERWQVIHYIRSLQADDKKLEYNQLVNTLNNIDMPAGEIVVAEEVHEVDVDHDTHGHDHLDGDTNQEGHSDDHGDHDHGH